jgi:hypothetical protein
MQSSRDQPPETRKTSTTHKAAIPPTEIPMTQPTPELIWAYKAACVRADRAQEAIEAAQEMHEGAMAAMRKDLAAAEDECARLEREIGR